MVDKLHILIDKMHYLPYTEKHKKTCFIRCHAAVWFLICFTALTLRISSEGHFFFSKSDRWTMFWHIYSPTLFHCYSVLQVKYTANRLCVRLFPLVYSVNENCL